MKILWIGPWLADALSTQVRGSMARALHDVGNEIGGVVIGAPGSWKTGGYDWVEYCPVRRSLLDKCMTQVHLARIVSRFQGDVLVLGEKVAHLAPIAHTVRAMMQRKNKIVIDVRTLPIPENENSHVTLKARGFWWKLKVGFPFADAWMGITPGLRDVVEARIPTRNLPCLIWGSAVDRMFLAYHGSNPLAERIGACGHEVNALYLGSLSKGRRIDLAVRAMAELENDSAFVGLHIVGTGDQVPELKQLVDSFGISRRVHIWDPVAYCDVPSVIQACDLGILPLPDCEAWNTSSALKLYEYMGVGLPILVSDIPAHRHAVGGQPFAYFMKEYSASGFKEALRRFLRTPKIERNQLRNLAKNFVSKNHTFDHRARTINRFLKKLPVKKN